MSWWLRWGLGCQGGDLNGGGRAACGQGARFRCGLVAMAVWAAWRPMLRRAVMFRRWRVPARRDPLLDFGWADGDGVRGRRLLPEDVVVATLLLRMVRVKTMILWIGRRRRFGVVLLLEGAVLKASSRRVQLRGCYFTCCIRLWVCVVWWCGVVLNCLR